MEWQNPLIVWSFEEINQFDFHDSSDCIQLLLLLALCMLIVSGCVIPIKPRLS